LWLCVFATTLLRRYELRIRVGAKPDLKAAGRERNGFDSVVDLIDFVSDRDLASGRQALFMGPWLANDGHCSVAVVCNLATLKALSALEQARYFHDLAPLTPQPNGRYACRRV